MTRLEPGLELVPGLTLVRRLGRGGMGEAWVAREASRNEEVVAKILPPDAPSERVALLRREARLVRKVRHPAIVPVYGFEQGPHGSAVVLRYMPGGDAGRLRGATPLEIVRLGRALAGALEHLHRLGVVHRDVKATNVLLDEEGRAHLADFGIAAVADPRDDEGLILHGGGSRASMSPQQRAGEAAQPADDVYALGVLLHELLAGQPLFPSGASDEEMDRGPRPSLDVALPPGLRALVESMLARSPADRPRDMAEVGEALRAAEAELAPPAPALSPPTAPPSSAGVRLQPPPRVPDVAPRPASPPVGASPVVPRPVAPRSEPGSAPRQGIGSRGQVVLFATLGLAVLFVVLVLPRWAQSPGPVASQGAEEEQAQGRDRGEVEEGGEQQGDSIPEAAVAERPPMPAEEDETPRMPVEAPPEAQATAGGPSESQPMAEEEFSEDRSGTQPETRGARTVPASRSEAPASPGNAEEKPERQFTTAMSDAHAALDRRDWASARQALARAGALRPASSSVADARRRLEDGERSAALATQRETARSFEGKEEWRRALAEYEAALKLDPTVAFALEGRDRTKARADLAQRLDFHIAHPLRLATDAVAAEAERLLQQAREVGSPGPRHRSQVSALEKAMVQVRTPVAVVLESDGETEIVVHKVGRLGAFTRKQLELRPGTYTVVGTRRGYRDVRRQLVIEPAAAPPPLVVRCEEEI